MMTGASQHEAAERGELELTDAIRSHLPDGIPAPTWRGHLTLAYEYRPGSFRTFTLHRASPNQFYRVLEP